MVTFKLWKYIYCIQLDLIDHFCEDFKADENFLCYIARFLKSDGHGFKGDFAHKDSRNVLSH